MKFVIEHTYARISPAEYEALHFDEDFSAALGEALNLGRTLLRLDRGPDRIVRHIHCAPRRDPDGAAAKAMKEPATFVEELEYEVGRYRGTWRTIPSVMPEKVTTRGTIEFEAVPGGTKRVVRGEVKVSIFVVGKIVERFIVAEIEKSYAGAARFTAEWLARRR